MAQDGSTDRAGRFRGGPKSLFACFITCLLVLLSGFFLLVAFGRLTEDTLYLGYLATNSPTFDISGVLAAISALLSITAIAGGAFALFRRKPGLALAFSMLALPTHFVIEGSRCDTAASCHLMGWAALPARAFGWRVRIRSVTDPNEAEGIASQAVAKSGSEDSPFKAKRFADHWIVSTINRDGWPGAHAVRIDTRTAATSLVPCRADQIRCGMEQPTVSDGRRVYRDDRLGLAATFPASRSVCTSRGDNDDRRGFYAMLRPPSMPCDIIDDSRQMGLAVARYRIDGCMVTQARSVPWQPLSPDTEKLFSSQDHPMLGGRPSVACELRENGWVQVSVYAFASSDLDRRNPSGTLYEAYVVTTPSHLAEDIRSFDAFLKSAHIGSLG